MAKCLLNTTFLCQNVAQKLRSSSRTATPKRVPPPASRRDLTVRAGEEMDDEFDMSAVGLEDLYDLVDASEMNSRAAWLPGTYSPEYLDGETLPGDFGFDPLGLGADPVNLAIYRESELIHGRWAMLGVAGMIAVEASGNGSWTEAPLWAVSEGSPTYFGADVPFDFGLIVAIEIAFMLFAEGKRSQADAESRLYPGGAFDPLGFAKGKDEAALNELKLKEIKNGRLAMVAVTGFYSQAFITGSSPLANLSAHQADPWMENIGKYDAILKNAFP